jgi:hypothetical protein
MAVIGGLLLLAALGLLLIGGTLTRDWGLIFALLGSIVLALVGGLLIVAAPFGDSLFRSRRAVASIALVTVAAWAFLFSEPGWIGLWMLSVPVAIAGSGAIFLMLAAFKAARRLVLRLFDPR